MRRRLRGILRPNAYHGELFKPPFFEGWYVKAIDSARRERLAVILGILRPPEQTKEHAFIQIFDGLRGQAGNIRFAASEFSASASVMDARLGRCRLTEHGLSLDVDREDVTLRGRIELGKLTPWPVTLRSPGIMGWYAWVPFMECYHGVVSMDHSVGGRVQWNDQTYDFAGGRGYLEKDWGRAFPSSWIWMQTNHFETEGVSLMASIARIPWIRRSFPGFIVGLLLDGRLFRFAEYTGARSRQLRVSPERIEWVLEDRRHRLAIGADRGTSTALIGPSFEDMNRVVDESLQARVEVKLSRRGWRGGLIYEGTAEPAGLELHGDLTEFGAKMV